MTTYRAKQSTRVLHVSTRLSTRDRAIRELANIGLRMFPTTVLTDDELLTIAESALVAAGDLHEGQGPG